MFIRFITQHVIQPQILENYYYYNGYRESHTLTCDTFSSGYRIPAALALGSCRHSLHDCYVIVDLRML